MHRQWICAVGALLLAASAVAQTAVSAGKGSYASTVPSAHLNDDGYYAPTPKTMLGEYSSLYMSAGLKTAPIPTNHWWTDLMIAQRANNGAWFQQQFDANGNAGQLWAYPEVVQPAQTGKTLYFPTAWVPNNSTPPALAQGAFDIGPGIFVENYSGIRLGAGDIALGDFTGSAYPAGWVATGGLAGTAPIQGGTWPGESPPVTGLIGNACVNTYRGTNATEGLLTSAAFTVQKHYIDLKVGGGNDTANTCVQLLVGGKVVLTATGQQDATLRWTQWDVSSYKGQSAQLVVRDSSTGSWGFILCNFIVETDNSADPSTLYTGDLTPKNATVSAYGDWSFDYTQADGSGNQVVTTVARGIPFVWDRISGVSPKIHLGAGTTLYNAGGTVINTNSGSFTASSFAFKIVDGNGNAHVFGVFAPTNTVFTVSADYVQPKKATFLVYGFLPAVANLAEFATFAYARPTSTVMKWAHNRGAASGASPGGSIDTTWTISTSPLQGTGTQTLQGWLPHHYRTTSRNLKFKSYAYLTPRGVMKVSAGTSFGISWPFRGIAPVLPAPHLNGVANDYDASRMATYMQSFAAIHPTNGADTYWQGKEFGISAQYMTMAAQLGQFTQFSTLQTALHNDLEDWFTYTPGKKQDFFARYPNWDALIGFNSSYGTVGFNDNHFHYGYFEVASALLAMQDQAFMNQYGPMVELVAKEYGNWDRTDTAFPFMRCFDVWEGHCYAGGLSSPGGENQESSSESMNAWVGMFLSGSLMGNAAMADAGAMGYAMESSAVNEYWQDWTQTNFPPGYGKMMAGILGSGGIAYGTYFSGDPAWIYSIQWTPANHWNNYLVRNKTFASNQYAALWQERTEASNYDKQYNTGGFILNDANDPEALGAYPGNYVLAVAAMFNPSAVAELFDTYWSEGKSIATDPTYPGSVYYITHSLRGLGDQDLDYYTSVPTSAVYTSSSGVHTYVIYNPNVVAQTATVYKNGVSVGTILVPAHHLVSTTTMGGSNASTPYYGIPASVPGTVQFVNFDFGGEGLSYYNPGGSNTGGEYRPSEGIDIEAALTKGAPDGTYDAVVSAGEWLRYTVNVAKSGPYMTDFRVASVGAGAFHIVDETGKTVASSIKIGSTGGTQTYSDTWVNLTLSSGMHTYKLIVDSGTLHMSRMRLLATGSAATIPLGKTISMKSVGDGFYVSADAAGANPLIANRTAASTWEEFVATDLGNGKVALQALANNEFVQVTGKHQLLASGATASSGQAFLWIDQGNGQFTLQVVGPSTNVTVQGSTTPLLSNSASIGAPETFTFTEM